MVHKAASSGFGRGADVYQQARPDYHQVLVDRFITRYGRGLVVELGAGTGTFTAQLASAGVSVMAVEPVAEMRAVLASRLPHVQIADGTAEDIPLDDATASTVVAAQAFHWFDHRNALNEIHRVLQTGGHLVTVWNVKDESVSWVSAYNAILDHYSGDTPRHRSMRWRIAIESDNRFELVDDWAMNNPKATTVDGVISRALSTSFVAAQSGEEQDRVAKRIQTLLKPYGPTLEFPYRAELQAWRSK